MLSWVIVWRVRSAAMLSRHENSGRSARITPNDSSCVFPSNVPAFCHWFKYPVAAESGTSRISSLVSLREYEYSAVKRPRKSTLAPNSDSAECAGLRFLLPRVCFTGTPPTTENVSYWASNWGRRPAVPYDARSFSSSMPLM